MLKLKPAKSMVSAISGNVRSSSERRPRLSIDHIAGNAPMKLTKPNTQEATKAPNIEKPAWAKICSFQH